jgi:hypothetical protein
MDKTKGKTTVVSQKSRENADYGIAQREGQAPKHTKGKQLCTTSHWHAMALSLLRSTRHATARKPTMKQTQSLASRLKGT